jgi:hypothetical protein
MGEESFRAGKLLFITVEKVDKSQHWHGESYPWALSIDLRIERWIGDTLSSTR